MSFCESSFFCATVQQRRVAPSLPQNVICQRLPLDLSASDSHQLHDLCPCTQPAHDLQKDRDPPPEIGGSKVGSATAPPENLGDSLLKRGRRRDSVPCCLQSLQEVVQLLTPLAPDPQKRKRRWHLANKKGKNKTLARGEKRRTEKAMARRQRRNNNKERLAGNRYDGCECLVSAVYAPMPCNCLCMTIVAPKCRIKG